VTGRPTGSGDARASQRATDPVLAGGRPWKRRVARGLLVFTALWPCVTLWLQARFDVDPWKLMSFGMYAAPGRRPEDVQLNVGGQEAEAYRKWRWTLGRLASPEALLRATKGDVEVRELRLDAESGRVVWRVETMVYGGYGISPNDGGPDR